MTRNFGQKCAFLAVLVSVQLPKRSLATRHEENLLEQHLQIIIEPAAALYLLEDLKDVVWRGASLLLDERKPLTARYGIVTLNMSESVNGMFTDAQNVHKDIQTSNKV